MNLLNAKYILLGYPPLPWGEIVLSCYPFMSVCMPEIQLFSIITPLYLIIMPAKLVDFQDVLPPKLKYLRG